MYKYSGSEAKIYSTLGIRGTTYEPGFNETRKIFGDLSGKKALDFGSGTGRTARLLLAMGAEIVVGVDHNQNMIDQAKLIRDKRIKFIKIKKKIPFIKDTFDVALAAHVFVEISSLKDMNQIIREIHRVLKPGGVLVIITNNSKAIGHKYRSYGYKKQKDLKDGDKIVCTIRNKKSFKIDDYYWSEEIYKKILEKIGFSVTMIYPTMIGPGWLEETTIAPHVVIKSIKTSINIYA